MSCLRLCRTVKGVARCGEVRLGSVRYGMARRILTEGEKMEIRNFQVSLTGTMPISFNNPNAIPSKKNKIKDYEQWEEDHWMERLYRNADGKVILPNAAIKKCAMQVCSLLDIKPPVGMLKSYGPLIDDCWHIDGEGSPIEFEDNQLVQWRAQVNPNPNSRKSGVGSLRIRPQINPVWKTAFTLRTIHDCFYKKIVEDILADAFLLKGVGEGRKIRGFGRATVTVLELDAG